eukprot:CAMPEP_0176106740 /NCGR_PEP_ID=MMETSP0120_2-20121206/53565_1 /TAXON_ID=160619 /ORGANISM="Kryptoperidinium foliaceum, Strain CCMP 1326" /LENGTH=721 /DNA_ID=CAMNT_0017440863 /DNA_START=43 /DNA_END=2208 /DNA_ORIENTATION=-
MKVAKVLLCLGAGASAVQVGQRAEARALANPIRKVVTMLQNMQAKVTEEGKREQELFDRFMCYCKTSGGDLDKSIAAAEAKIEEIEAATKEGRERKAQLEAELKEHEASRDEAKETMSKATALREKQAAAFAKESADLKTNVAAITKAVAALEKGASGAAFLQTPAAQQVRTWAMERATLPDESRQELLSFLSGAAGASYAPQSGEITGILKQMSDEMTADLEAAIAAEEEAIKVYEELMAAKKKEVSTLQKQIESKMKRVGELAVQLAESTNDIEDTKEAMAADKKFKQELEEGCATKEQEWDEIKKTRAEELVALAETIKVLNDDDALEIFKKTLPSASASFMQVQVTAASQRARALEILRKSSSNRPAVDLIAMALSGKTAGFEKVIALIDEMVLNLKAEQKADDAKKEYCEKEFDVSDDKKKDLEQSIKDSETTIDELKGSLEKLAEEISALQDGIIKLDKSVTEATEQRKQENAEYKDLMSSNSVAKEVLGWAKNRLNKFYNPKLYRPPAKAELSEEDRIAVNMGGTMAPTMAGGIAGTGIGAAFVQLRAVAGEKAAPPPPPETFGPYTKKSEESNGVIQMIDLLVADLDKEMQEAEVSEKDAQADYEKMMADASEKRAADSKSITEKSDAKATAEEALQEEKEKKKDTTKELMATLEYIQSLHGECDWLMQNYAARREARVGEIDAISKAKDVLNGADYALLQRRVARRTSFLGF